MNWLARLVIVMSAIIAVLIALAIIVLRYWVLPDIEQYHDNITDALATTIGSPVSISKIEVDWQSLQPHLNLTDVRILDEQRQPALVLPRIVSDVSWMSLFTAELRLASLEIDSPELLIRRDAQGKFFIGGVALTKQGGNNKFADWLLHQSRMVVRNALIVWVDEQRNAQPLVLQQVNLRIENKFGRHRFALRALPPEALATPLDVRGDFRGASFDDLQEWRGQIFTQMDYTDVTAWRAWLDLPGEFSRGRGALRGWLNVEGGKVSGVTADVMLHDVVTRLAEDVPEMLVRKMRGRAAWHEVAGGVEISTSHLAMRLQNGIELPPTDFYFFTAKVDQQHADQQQTADGQNAASQIASPPVTSAPVISALTSSAQASNGILRANLLQLDNLVVLAKFFPLQAELRAQLEAYAPKGRVSNLDAQWQAAPGKPASYRLKGHFENLAVNQVGKMPGFSGLTMDVDGNETGGTLTINARRMTVDAPGIMREQLSFTTLTGQAGWQRKGEEIAINVDNVVVINDDLAGNVYGSYQTRAGTRGVLDLTGRLTRGDIRRAARYTPLFALHQKGNDWLNGALLAGHTEDFSIRIKGNLSDFPLRPETLGTNDVLFKIGGHAQDAVLEFDKQWPRIENISGEFLIQGNKLEVKTPSASMAGVGLQNVTVSLPDMSSKNLVLEINGAAAAASNEFLQFIQHSPVRGYLDGATDGMSASGNGHLDLSLQIPLTGDSQVPAEAVAAADMGAVTTGQSGRSHKPVQVSGTFRVQDNDIDLGKGVPLLRNVRGSLSFTESGMKAKGIQAEVLGGTASINAQTGDDGVLHASVRGRSNLNVLRISDPHPLLNYLHGSTGWEVDVSAAKTGTQVIINSDLRGVSSSLPQPFAKGANEVMPLRVEISSVSKGKDVISAQLGKLLSANLTRRDENGEMVVKQGAINFGENLVTREKWVSRQKSPDRDGVWVTGSLPELSMQGWNGLVADDEKSGSGVPIVGANLFIGNLTGYGQSFKAMRISAAKRGEGLAVQLYGSMLNGEVVWRPKTATPLATSGKGYESGGKVSVHLRNLHWSKEPGESAAPANLPGKSLLPGNSVITSPLRPASLPALEIAIDSLQIKGRQIGRLEMVGHPDGRDWRMRRLRITNPDGALMGDGVWHDGAGLSGVRSQVNLVLDISDAGKMLERSGYPDTVKNGSGRLAANLSWAGTPDEFNYATLNGTLKLDAGKGRFVKMDPGAGKLLSILSMQALPKHITTLDFTDVFSKGFQFDNIVGEAAIKNGVMDTQEFHIYGSAAKVALKGSVDLNRETQNLSVKVFPTIGDSVSLLAVFAINQAAGIAGLIADKLLGNPLDKLVSYEYNVSGTWNDPKVDKVGKNSVKPTTMKPPNK